MPFYICELYLVYRRNWFDSLIVHDQVIKRGFLAVRCDAVDWDSA